MQKADIAWVRARAEAMAAVRYPELIPDVGQEHELLSKLVLDTSSYARVVGNPGEPHAALIAQTAGNLWATKRHSAVLVWYSDQAVTGAGTALLRDFRDWVKTQKSIVVAGLIDDFGMDDQLKRVVKRFGFIQRGGALLYFPRGAKA